MSSRVKPGIAALHRLVEKTFLGGEQGAAAVDVEPAAFQHHRPLAVRDGKEPVLETLCHFAGHRIVQFPIGILGPAVEAVVQYADFRALGVAHEEGPEVARPAAVGGHAESGPAGLAI
jgi:hypothetical protein